MRQAIYLLVISVAFLACSPKAAPPAMHAADSDKAIALPTAATSDKAVEKPAIAAPAGPKDPEIAALYAKIRDCPVADFQACPAAKDLETLAKTRNNDPTRQQSTYEAMLDCIDAGNSAQRYACVYATNFSLFPAGRNDNVNVAKRLLAVIRVEKAEHTSSRLGEFLSNFYASAACGAVHEEILDLIKDQNLPEFARTELIRLGTAPLKRPAHVDALYALLQDNKSSEELRIQIVGVVYQIEDQVTRAKFEAWMIAQLDNPSLRLAQKCVETLGEIGGPAGFTAVMKNWQARYATLTDGSWASATARGLQNFLARGDKVAIDRKAAYATVMAIAQDEKIPPFYRSWALYALERSGEARALKDLKMLANDKDAGFAKTAKETAQRVEQSTAENQKK